MLHRHRTKGVCVCVYVCLGGGWHDSLNIRQQDATQTWVQGYLILLKLKHSTEGCYAGKKGGWGGCCDKIPLFGDTFVSHASERLCFAVVP